MDKSLTDYLRSEEFLARNKIVLGLWLQVARLLCIEMVRCHLLKAPPAWLCYTDLEAAYDWGSWGKKTCDDRREYQEKDLASSTPIFNTIAHDCYIDAVWEPMFKPGSTLKHLVDKGDNVDRLIYTKIKRFLIDKQGSCNKENRNLFSYLCDALDVLLQRGVIETDDDGFGNNSHILLKDKTRVTATQNALKSAFCQHPLWAEVVTHLGQRSKVLAEHLPTLLEESLPQCGRDEFRFGEIHEVLKASLERIYEESLDTVDSEEEHNDDFLMSQVVEQSSGGILSPDMAYSQPALYRQYRDGVLEGIANSKQFAQERSRETAKKVFLEICADIEAGDDPPLAAEIGRRLSISKPQMTHYMGILRNIMQEFMSNEKAVA